MPCPSAKYLSAAVFLRSNAQLNDSIKKVFPKLAKRRRDFAPVNITDDVQFIGLDEFNTQIKSTYIAPASSLKISPSEFKAKFQFTSYKLPLLENLVIFPDSKLFLTFSEPAENFLMARITTYIPNIRMGQVMYVLFIFDENDVVEDVILSSAILH